MSATDNLFVSESQADEFELLMESARPDLYRMNAFRVSGLAVEATAREIARLGEKLKVLEKMGGALPLGGAGVAGGAGGVLPLNPPPEAAMVHAAIERLRDPERRLVDEFFWFWPQQSGERRDDEALQALARGEVAAAEKVWMSRSDSASDGAARHNLAVLHHLTALDLETQAQPLNEEQRQRLDDSWRNAWKLWAGLIEQEGVWARLAERVRELDDPRLTEETVARLRASLPLALLMINGRLAIRAAEHGQPEDADRRRQIIADSGFASSTQHEALRRAVEPLRARVKTLCKAAETEADADPAHADAATRRLLDQARPLLDVFNQVLPAGHPTRDAAHDEVALRAADCLIPFGNKTENWRRALELMEAAQPVAASESARARIREHLKTLKDNAESGGDWCGEGYYDLPEPVLEVLESAREHHRAKRWDMAVGKLTDLLAGKSIVKVDEHHRPLVNQSLAVCLSQRAVSSLNGAMERHNRPIPILLKLEAFYSVYSTTYSPLSRREMSESMYGAESSGFGMCMVCERDYLQSYYHITYKDMPCILCFSCKSQLEDEQKERKKDLRKTIKEVAKDLVLAASLNRADPAIQQNLSNLRKIAVEADVSLPSLASVRVRKWLATVISERVRLQLRLWRGRAWALRKRAVVIVISLLALFLPWFAYNFVSHLNRDPDATMRLYNYGFMSRTRTMKGLIVSLTLRKDSLRKIATEKLRGFDPQWPTSDAARAAIPDLVDVLKTVSEPDNNKFSTEELLAVFSAIREVGADAVPLLAPMLRHEDRRFRINAAHALGAIGPNAQAAISELRMVSFSSDSEVELAAEKALAAIRQDKVK